MNFLPQHGLNVVILDSSQLNKGGERGEVIGIHSKFRSSVKILQMIHSVLVCKQAEWQGLGLSPNVVRVYIYVQREIEE